MPNRDERPEEGPAADREPQQSAPAPRWFGRTRIARQLTGLGLTAVAASFAMLVLACIPPHEIAARDGKIKSIRPELLGARRVTQEFAAEAVVSVDEVKERGEVQTRLHLRDGRVVSLPQFRRAKDDRTAHPSVYTMQEFLRLAEAGRSVAFSWYPLGKPRTHVRTAVLALLAGVGLLVLARAMDGTLRPVSASSTTSCD